MPHSVIAALMPLTDHFFNPCDVIILSRKSYVDLIMNKYARRYLARKMRRDTDKLNYVERALLKATEAK